MGMTLVGGMYRLRAETPESSRRNRLGTILSHRAQNRVMKQAKANNIPVFMHTFNTEAAP